MKENTFAKMVFREYVVFPRATLSCCCDFRKKAMALKCRLGMAYRSPVVLMPLMPHTSVVLPEHIPSIKRKTWLKLLGVTLQDNPCNWDLHFEETLKKSKRTNVH